MQRLITPYDEHNFDDEELVNTIETTLAHMAENDDVPTQEWILFVDNGIQVQLRLTNDPKLQIHEEFNPSLNLLTKITDPNEQ